MYYISLSISITPPFPFPGPCKVEVLLVIIGGVVPLHDCPSVEVDMKKHGKKRQKPKQKPKHHKRFESGDLLGQKLCSLFLFDKKGGRFGQFFHDVFLWVSFQYKSFLTNLPPKIVPRWPWSLQPSGSSWALIDPFWGFWYIWGAGGAINRWKWNTKNGWGIRSNTKTCSICWSASHKLDFDFLIT